MKNAIKPRPLTFTLANAVDYVTYLYEALYDRDPRLTLWSGELPTCHETREQIADALADAGFAVRVHRVGTGNGSHSGRMGCRVERIEVVGLLNTSF